VLEGDAPRRLARRASFGDMQGQTRDRHKLNSNIARARPVHVDSQNLAAPRHIHGVRGVHVRLLTDG